MWNRQEVKAKGKEAFKRNYWNSVMAALIFTIFFGATGSAVYKKSGDVSSEITTQYGEDPDFLAIILIVCGIIGVIILISTLIRIFLVNPIEVGCGKFFITNLNENAAIGEIGYPFKTNYMNIVFGLFLRDLLIGLGLCLFLIPGIILSYSYRLVPYILADDPTIGSTDALKKSRELMKGNKWNSFVYDLSFILWDILAACTCNIVGVFYVAPYKESSDAALYKAIRGETNVIDA